MTTECCAKCQGCPQKALARCRDNPLLVCMVLAIVLGLGLGFGLRPLNLSGEAISWIQIWGELFLRMLSLIILPLVPSCIIIGLSNLDAHSGGRLGVVTVVTVFLNVLVAVSIGIIMCVLIRPGDDLAEGIVSHNVTEAISYTDVLTDFLRNLIPDNIVKACMQYSQTVSVLGEAGNVTSKEVASQEGINILGLVSVSVVVGIACQSLGEATRPVVSLAHALYNLTLKILDYILWFSPLGILSLITGSLLGVADLGSALASMALFILTCLSALALYVLVVLPLVFYAITRKNPYRVLCTFSDCMLGAAGPPSVVVVLQMLLQEAKDTLLIDPRVADFFIPTTISINRPGSAQFIAVSAIFVAQSFAIELTAGQICVLCVLVTLLSLAIPSVPSASIVVLISVGGFLNIPIQPRVGLILSLEWLLDRCRTGVNAGTVGVMACLVDHLCSGHLDLVGQEQDKQDVMAMWEYEDNTLRGVQDPQGPQSQGTGESQH